MAKHLRINAPLRIIRRRGRRVDLERRLVRVTKALLAAGYSVGEIAGLSLTASGVTELLHAKDQRRIRQQRR
jgi:hypothetical protein